MSVPSACTCLGSCEEEASEGSICEMYISYSAWLCALAPSTKRTHLIFQLPWEALRFLGALGAKLSLAIN